MAGYKKEMVEYKPDLIQARRCMRGGRLTWGRGSRRRKTPRAERDKDRVRIGSECQTADVTESYLKCGQTGWDCGAAVLFELVLDTTLLAPELDKVLCCVLLPLSLRPAVVLCPWRWWRIVIVKRLQQQFVESRVKGRGRGRQGRTPALSLILRVKGVKRVLRWGAEREQEHVGAELDRLQQRFDREAQCKVALHG